MPENGKTVTRTAARPVRETPEREIAASDPAEKAERTAGDAGRVLAKKAAAEKREAAKAEAEADEKVRADLERLWPASG